VLLNILSCHSQLDLAYVIHFKGPGTRGNQVRKRVDTGLISGRRFKIHGLPVSCLDPGWLITQTDVQKRMLGLVEMEYDFSFPTELLENPE
jgi:hypothetical protein